MIPEHETEMISSQPAFAQAPHFLRIKSMIFSGTGRQPQMEPRLPGGGF